MAPLGARRGAEGTGGPRAADALAADARSRHTGRRGGQEARPEGPSTAVSLAGSGRRGRRCAGLRLAICRRRGRRPSARGGRRGAVRASGARPRPPRAQHLPARGSRGVDGAHMGASARPRRGRRARRLILRSGRPLTARLQAGGRAQRSARRGRVRRAQGGRARPVWCPHGTLARRCFRAAAGGEHRPVATRAGHSVRRPNRPCADRHGRRFPGRALHRRAVVLAAVGRRRPDPLEPCGARGQGRGS